jgi:hypothetical protein
MIRAIVTAIASLLIAGTASAHRVGIPMTTVDYNVRAGAWEVVHRVSAHDLEAAFQGEPDAMKLFDTEQGILRIGNYAASAFRVYGKDVSLSYVGAELDGDMAYIYFELRAPDQTLAFDSDLLMGEGETGFAHVNVVTSGGIRSLIFAPESGAQSVVLKRPVS